MNRVSKRERARRDLLERWVWYAEHSGTELADRFLAEAEAAAKALAHQPALGAPVFTRRPGLRELRRWPISGDFHQILIFYLPTSNGVELVRVLHGKRNWTEMLEEGPVR